MVREKKNQQWSLSIMHITFQLNLVDNFTKAMRYGSFAQLLPKVYDVYRGGPMARPLRPSPRAPNK
jgi:hypothetical protein